VLYRSQGAATLYHRNGIVLSIMGGIVLFVGYALISCLGLYWLKSATDWWTVRFVFGGGLYALGAGIWLVILRMYPLSLAFPIASGALMIGTTLAGYVFLGEDISWLHLLGIVIISLGISILALQGR